MTSRFLRQPDTSRDLVAIAALAKFPGIVTLCQRMIAQCGIVAGLPRRGKVFRLQDFAFLRFRHRALSKSSFRKEQEAGSVPPAIEAAAYQRLMWRDLKTGIRRRRKRGGGRMDAYEIRILNERHRPVFQLKEYFSNDLAAVREAKVMAEGRAVEVWLGVSRIYWKDASQPGA